MAQVATLVTNPVFIDQSLYRSITLGKIENTEKVKIDFKEKKKKFDPEVVYKNKPNPTKI